MFGHGIRDVQILALLGRKEDALQALRTAVDEGYRGSIAYDNWLLDDDPYLESLRDDQRFDEIVSEIEALNAEMYERIVDAEESGNWAALRALSRSS